MPSSSTTTFPSSGKYVQSIRESCRALRLSSGIKVERDAIERLLLSPSFVDSYQRVSKNHGLAMPLQFPSVVAELNLIAVLSLLNFASGYRQVLHELTGRGAWDNMRALVFSLYISGSSGTETDFLSARGMQAITVSDVAEQMRIETHVERPHESLPGVTVSEVGPIYELVQLISQTMNETGTLLLKMGYPDLGTLVLEALQNGKKAANGGDLDLDVALEQIVKAIPAFQDMSIVDGQPVYCFKKALFLLAAVEIRFSSRSSEIPVPKTTSLPVFSDNVLPSILIHLGVLDISSCHSLPTGLFPDHSSELAVLLAKSEDKEVVARMPKEPPKDGPAVTEKQAYVLRAAAIDACEIVVDTAHNLNQANVESAGVPISALEWMRGIMLQDLDMWLWSVAKDRPDYRKLERFALKNTVMF